MDDSHTSSERAQAELLLARIVDFARLLWELGLDVGTGQVVEVAESLRLVNVGRRQEFYTFLKVNFVSKHEQEPVFDQAFAYFWRSRGGKGQGTAPELERNRSRRALALPSHRHPDDEQEQEKQLSLRIPETQRHPASRLAEARRTRREKEREESEGSRTFSQDEVLRRK